MPQQSKVGNASWSGLPYILDGILCLFGVISLGFLIGLTEEFHRHGAAGDDRRKQLAPVLGFVAFAQACELADRIWRICCRAVTRVDSDEVKVVPQRRDPSQTVPCGCVEFDEQCFADDEKSPQPLTFGNETHIHQDERHAAPAWGRYRCELSLQTVKRGRGEYHVAKVRQNSSVAVIEDLHLTPRASESGTRMRSVDIAYDADCDSVSDNGDHPIESAGPGWVLVDECNSVGLFSWDEA